MMRVAILGSGLMGRSITEHVATLHIPVALIRMSSTNTDETWKQLNASFDRAVERRRITTEQRDAALSHICVTSEREAVMNADVVIESIVETLLTKRALLREIEPLLVEHVVLATNTSSLRVEDVGGSMMRPDRLIGMHFFNPVSSMKLVEMAPSCHTSMVVVERARKFIDALGKIAVVVADTSGYVVNSLLIPYIINAIRVLESNTAQAADIDVAMQLGCGHPMGPLALADLIGLDIVCDIARNLDCVVPVTLLMLIDAGKLGRKTGVGFHAYTGKR